MGWVARRAFGEVEGIGTPVAVYDRGDVGKEAITRVLAPDAGTAVSRVLALSEAVGEE
jgi:hydroxymethylpyrimidine/phosphomethylpyrimidine kinase